MSTPTPITWFCVNLKSGGLRVTPGDSLLHRHGSLDMEWLQRFPEIVRLSPTPPDVIFLQEATGFNHYGDELLLYTERLLTRSRLGRYRGFLTLSRRSHHHQVVFINTSRLAAVHHWHGADPDESRTRYGWLEVTVDHRDDHTLWLRSVHLDPRDPDSRLADARQIHYGVPSGARAMMAGDWNSTTSRRSAAEGEPQRHFAAMPANRRYGTGIWPPTTPHGDTDPDTRALDYLIDNGWTRPPHRPARHHPHHHTRRGPGRRTDHRPVPDHRPPRTALDMGRHLRDGLLRPPRTRRSHHPRRPRTTVPR